MILHVMLLVAFGIKAAVFPLSFWLPDSYPTAPAPVTAVFAGLLTKVGVYAIMRTEMIIFPGDELNTPIMIVAALTMIVGILGAVAQSDIKRLSVVHAGEPHRLHAVRHWARHRRRALRGDVLRRAPHHRADHPVSRDRLGRASGRNDEPSTASAAC